MAEYLSGLSKRAAAACMAPTLNALMELGPQAWSALRRDISRLLSAEHADWEHRISAHLTPMADAELMLPVDIPNFTDFYASVFHATNAGRFFRPDNPLMPNYKYVPVAYHSRASSVRVSGTPVVRPKGQIKPADAPAPSYAPSRALDYRTGARHRHRRALGTRHAGADRRGRALRVRLLPAQRLVGARHPGLGVQPLGPFLGKNFHTTISPWIVTDEALAPYRTHAFRRPEGDPAPLAYLTDKADQEHGGLAIELSAYLLSDKMREQGIAPHQLSRSHSRRCTGRWRR